MAFTVIGAPTSGSIISVASFGTLVKNNFDALWPYTTNGDLSYAAGATAVKIRLAIGTVDQVLTVAGGVPTWAAGSKKTLTTTGDLLYASAANILARLAIGSTGGILRVTGGAPGWLARGSALQILRTNSGGTDIEWASIAATPWTTVSSGSLSNVLSLDLSGLSGYKRYRIRTFIQGAVNNGGIGGYTVQLNGVTGAATHQYAGVKVINTTVSGFNNSSTLFNVADGAIANTLGTNEYYAYVDFTVEVDTSGSHRLVAWWRAGGMSDLVTQNFDASGTGTMTTAASSITEIKLTWSATSTLCNGYYLLEGSND